MAPDAEGGSPGTGPSPWQPRVTRRTEGASVAALLDRHGAMPVAAALLVLDDVLEGLPRVHAGGRAQGDVRPALVRVDQRGRCRIVEAAGAAASLSGGRAGSLQYSAPEVRRGEAASTASDLYSAAALFFEAVTGLPPLAGRDVAATSLDAGATPDLDDPVPEGVRSLVDEGLSLDPKRRPATADAFRADLARAGDDHLGEGWRSSGRAWLRDSAAALAPVAEPAATPLSPAPSPAPYVPAPRWSPERIPFGLLQQRRRDPRVVAGIGIAVTGLLMVVIGGAALTGSPPRTNASAAPNIAISTPAPSSATEGAGSAEPSFPAFPSAEPSFEPSPSQAPAATQSAAATAVPQPTAAPPSPDFTFTPLPLPTPPPAPSTPPPTPTPSSCLIFC